MPQCQELNITQHLELWLMDDSDLPKPGKDTPEKVEELISLLIPMIRQYAIFDHPQQMRLNSVARHLESALERIKILNNPPSPWRDVLQRLERGL